MPTVFYSWQSDAPNSTNRGLIGDALDLAVRAIGADVSTVTGLGEGGGRPSPNPNVLLELGYAAHALGWSRILLVVNSALGGIERLPFDLRSRRAILYSAAVTEPDRAGPRKQLAGSLERGLRSILADRTAAAPPPGREAEAIGAIERNAPEHAARVKAFMEDLASQLKARTPASGDDDALLGAIEGAHSLVLSFARVARAASRQESGSAALALFASFEAVLSGYTWPAGRAGFHVSTDFDFHKFLGHELLVVLVAALVREGRIAVLGEMLGQRLLMRGTGGSGMAGYTAMAQHVSLLETRNHRLDLRRSSLHADLLKEAFEGPLSEAATFAEFRAAEYFLFLRAEFAGDDSAILGVAEIWKPWSLVYSSNFEIELLVSAEAKAHAKELSRALGLDGSIDALRERLRARAGNLRKYFPSVGALYEPHGWTPRRLGSGSPPFRDSATSGGRQRAERNPEAVRVR